MRDPAGRGRWRQQAALLIALVCMTTSSFAQELHRRVPQVTVQGTGLQDLLASLEAWANASSDQVDAELLKKRYQSHGYDGGPPPRLALEIELVRASPGTSLGIYGGHATEPERIEVFPPEARPGWFAWLDFRPDPDRVRVVLFDEHATVLVDRTHPGGDTLGVGFYLSGPGGMSYSQDARNPGHQPHALFYDGVPWYSWVIAWEDPPVLQPSDHDYDDVVIALSLYSEGPFTTDTRRTSWASLKARFR